MSVFDRTIRTINQNKLFNGHKGSSISNFPQTARFISPASASAVKMTSSNSINFLAQMGLKSDLLAGLSFDDMRRYASVISAMKLARKNLWLVSIEPENPRNATLADMERKAGDKVANQRNTSLTTSTGEITSRTLKDTANSVPINSNTGRGIMSVYNILATNLHYSPITIENETFQIGSALVDSPTTGQPTDLSLTVMDDEQGTIKRFFKDMASRVIHSDGTVGVQADGLVKIRRV